MTPAEHLSRARALLEDPSRWTKGQYARDEDGCNVAPHVPDAVSWCALGALWKFGEKIAPAELYLEQALPPFSKPGLPDYNDSLTDHADLLAWFDRAIALAEQEQP